MILQWDDSDDEPISVEEPPSSPSDPPMSPDQSPVVMHLSLHAMLGGNGAGTIKVLAAIRGSPIQVLIDGGSSDNFLHPCLAKFLKLEVEPAPPLRLMVGDGSKLHAEGMVRELLVSIQGLQLCLLVILFPVAGADLILGAAWLGSIGPHVHDYIARNIKFTYGGQEYTFQGQIPSSADPAQVHHLKRFRVIDAIAECYTIEWDSIVEPHTEQSQAVSLALQQLLDSFQSVFSVPSGLPPPRLQDHTIPLVEGSAPVQVHPYRYPHSQKEQIEKMVQDMLDEGIIQPSRSPFSSPIILVKKKDDSWRFCTDYRALNAITIKDKFPIPTVDELLDEVHGAVYFSKLDLRSGYHQILVLLLIVIRLLFERIMVTMSGL